MRKILRVSFYALVLVSAAIYAMKNTAGLGEALNSISLLRIALAAVFVLAGYCLRFNVWRLLTGGFGFGSSPGYEASTWFLSYLGRYLPGNAGLVAVRLTAYPGVERRRIAGATAVEYGLTLGAASCLVLAGLARIQGNLPRWVPGLTACFSALILLMTSPGVFGWVSRLVLRVFGKPPLEMLPGYGRHLLTGVVALLASSLHGIAFFLILPAPVGGSSIQGLLAASSGYYLGGLAGAFFFFSPAGVGVRETLTVLALGGALGVDEVAVASVMMRGITVVSELFLAAAASIWWRIESKGRIDAG